MEQVGIREILDTLASSASIFLRGLPGNSDLQNLATAGVFSAVLCNNVVNIDDDIDQDALQLCYRKGWLHADKIGLGEPKDIGYVFASPFHRWYVEWSLFDNVPAVPFEANNILDFVIDVIRNFKPQLLSAERRIGPGYVQRPPEAQYQDEFYRSCHKCSKGSLKTFPEFGTAKGRVDFYIPAKKWGVELLRDGDRLGDHSGRFTSGAYRGLPLDKYVILDCSDTRPKIRHPSMCTVSVVPGSFFAH